MIFSTLVKLNKNRPTQNNLLNHTAGIGKKRNNIENEAR